MFYFQKLIINSNQYSKKKIPNLSAKPNFTKVNYQFLNCLISIKN